LNSGKSFSPLQIQIDLPISGGGFEVRISGGFQARTDGGFAIKTGGGIHQNMHLELLGGNKAGQGQHTRQQPAQKRLGHGGFSFGCHRGSNFCFRKVASRWSQGPRRTLALWAEPSTPDLALLP